jgi:hypothetical protein
MLISSAGYPNGLAGYKAKAQELLRASAMGDNPFEGMSPEIPLGCKLHFGDADYEKFEEGGLEVMQHVGFVLVAGGESDFFCSMVDLGAIAIFATPAPFVSAPLCSERYDRGINCSTNL